MQMKEANRGGIGIDPSGYNSFYTFGTGDIPSTGTDLLMFDEELIVSKIKLLWLKAKGFDSSDTEREYANNFMQATSNDVAAPILGLGNQGMVRDRLLGGLNFPITGFGS